MATTAPFLTLEQFEQTYADQKPYYEYWFGQAIQKSMPTSQHGVLQGLLFMQLISKGWRAACEAKLKLSSFAEPIPDLVADPQAIESPYPTRPLALCIEILSPTDDLPEVLQKCAHYLDWGVPTAWIFDPEKRKAYCMTRTQPQPVTLFENDVIAAEPGLSLALRDIFGQLNQLSS